MTPVGPDRVDRRSGDRPTTMRHRGAEEEPMTDHDHDGPDDGSDREDPVA